MAIYLCMLIFVYLAGSMADTGTKTDAVGLPSTSEMWGEIQRLRALINQETDLRLAFEQNFLTHLNTVATLEKCMNDKSKELEQDEEKQEARLSTLEGEMNATKGRLRQIDNITNTLASDIQKALAKGCLTGYENVHTDPPPTWPQTLNVEFSKPFDEVPVVTYGLVLLDSLHNVNVRSHNELSAISKSGFTLKMMTWADTVQYGVAISWMACPKLK